jgi:hypothetical protein
MGLPESVLILGGVSYLCVKRYHALIFHCDIKPVAEFVALDYVPNPSLPGRIQDGIKSRKMGSVSRMQLTTSIMLGGFNSLPYIHRHAPCLV